MRAFYTALADRLEVVLGSRPFVPHEHYDPLVHCNFLPTEVDAAERDQVCNKSGFLVVVTVAPSWGGGIEVEMARNSGVPVFLLCERTKLEERKISRLLRGNLAVVATLAYEDNDHALDMITGAVRSHFRLQDAVVA